MKIKTALKMVLLSLVFLIGIGGCATARAPQVRMNTLDPTLQKYATMWRVEVARLHPNADVVLVHGGDYVAGQWVMATDPTYEHVEPVETVIARYKRPGRDLVLVSCNPGHVVLHHHPGVFYFTDSVWLVPDRAITYRMFRNMDEGGSRRTLDGKVHSYHHVWSLYDNGNDPPMRWVSSPEIFGNIYEAIEAK